ncbi:D-aminoacylase domain protein [Candidatus Sulfopaludibacter sp. SbA4]|nr:D-aminoacylase domain protein [Candidatus Sulfopaludibacter sp. SbA4]
MSKRRFPLLLCALPLVAAAADYDVLIRNARVMDGSGNPWFRADVAVKEGRIAAVGRLANASATRTIDARERVVAPGFIDVHVHVEGNIERNPRADNFLLDGVTTVITGNCGGSELNLAAWFEKLDKLGLGINVASLVGHNSVRREVMGTANRLATPEEIQKMQALVDRAMREGAVGFSTGLEYVPGTYSNTAEVVALAKAAAAHGGVYTSHMRDEGIHEIETITEAVNVGKEAGMPVEISHLKIDRRRVWGASDQLLALIEKFRREGVDVVADQYPYDRASTNLGIRLPTWALAEGKIKERLADPATRRKIAEEMKRNLADMGEPDYSFATVARFTPDASYEGKTISEIAAMKGRAPGLDGDIETIFDLMNAGGAGMIYRLMGEADIERIMRYPYTAIASDGGVTEVGVGNPHPRSYGTNARVLAEYVRVRGVLKLEDAIRRMTSLPARTFGLSDRGLVREGMAADLVMFDPARVEDKATYAKPHQYSQGFDMVLVNGGIVVDGGKLTDARSGHTLRHRP